MLRIDIFLIMALAFGLFKLGIVVQKKFGILPIILFLILGIIFGSGGLALLDENFYFFANPKFFPSQSSYNTFLLYLMFFGAGFSMNLKKNGEKKEKSSIVVRLMSLPVNIEGFVVGISLYLLLTTGLAGFELPLAQCFFISFGLAMASPANIIPISMQKISEGKVGKKNITESMIVASSADNLTPMVFLIPAMILTVGQITGVQQNIVVVLISNILFFVLVVILAFGFGFVVSKISKPFAEKIEATNGSTTLYAVAHYLVLAVLIYISYFIPVIGSAMGMYGIFFAMFAGAAINTFDDSAIKTKLRMDLTRGFSMFGSPVVFTTVGAGVSLLVFKEISMIIIILIVICISVAVKSYVTYLSLKDVEGIEKADIRYAIACFVPKGIVVVNFLTIITPILGGYNSPLMPFMAVLAAINILITIPIGVIYMNKIADEELARIESK